jgi:signal transduction histidine kinase
MDRRQTGLHRRRDDRSEQSRLRSIVERLADGIVVVDASGVIRFANPAAQRLFGRKAEELVGSPLGFPVVVRESAEVELVRPDGESLTVELRVVDAEWHDAPAQLVSLRDVTDRKRAQERERQLAHERAARAEAEAASEAKSEFLAMMSHELRTPLNAVIGYAELLDLGIGGPLTVEQRQQVVRIRTSGRHLLGLVNEVLDLAKIEEGRLAVHMGVGRVGDAADAALALVQPRAEEKGIDLVDQCLGDSSVMYEGDEDRVRQILVNLLSNAVKFTDPGGRVVLECSVASTPDAEARLTARDQWVYLRVTDTGVGIPTEQLPLIFEPFVQGESGHTRSNDGSGLGLTISRRLARLMGGDLTVRSEVGKGSAFTLWLPAAAPVPADQDGWHEASSSRQRVHGLGKVGDVLLREIEPLLEAFTLRIRTEELAAGARSLRFAQLADHLGSYLADLGCVLIAIEETGGQPSALLADASDIQRVLAERHGAQRARLGWTVPALRREYAILRQELDRLITRRALGIQSAAIGEAMVILTRFLEQAEELSVRALSRASAPSPDTVSTLDDRRDTPREGLRVVRTADSDGAEQRT